MIILLLVLLILDLAMTSVSVPLVAWLILVAAWATLSLISAALNSR